MINKLLILVTLLTAYVSFPLVPMTYHIYVDKDIPTNMGYFDKEISWLRFADKNDTVIVHITTNGGGSYATMKLINAILVSEAKTIAKVDTAAYSAGGMILVACDDFEVNEFSEILFHKSGYYQGGKRVTVKCPVVDKFYEKHIKPLLTPVEQIEYELGQDVFIWAPDFYKRVHNSDAQSSQ